MITDTNTHDADDFDNDGFDAEGYDRNGFDDEGYDNEGYDSESFDRDGNCYPCGQEIQGLENVSDFECPGDEYCNNAL